MADTENGDAVNRVKQLQLQLKELSNASKQRNNYMEEMKKVNAAGLAIFINVYCIRSIFSFHRILYTCTHMPSCTPMLKCNIFIMQKILSDSFE